MILGWLSSEHRAISLTADCEIPVYWICSPSLSVSGQPYPLISVSSHTWLEFLDGKLPNLAMTTNSLVDSSISTTTDEPDDFISVNYSDLALVSNIWTNSPVTRIYLKLARSIR